MELSGIGKLGRLIGGVYWPDVRAYPCNLALEPRSPVFIRVAVGDHGSDWLDIGY